MEDFPSFNKTPLQSAGSQKTNLALIFFVTVGLCLAIAVSFRFLSGSKTLRGEIFPRFLSTSESGQSHLLKEWLGHLEEGETEWRPSGAEEFDLLHWASARPEELKAPGITTSVMALHVASYGPGIEPDNPGLAKVLVQATSEDAKSALGVFLLRQKVFNEQIFEFFEDIQTDSRDFLRKISGSGWEYCLKDKKQSIYHERCKSRLISLLADPNDEVRWNVSLAILRTLPENDLAYSKARSEINDLSRLISTKDAALTARFGASTLEALSKEIEKVNSQPHAER